MSFQSSFDRSAWTGSSGTQIGFSGAYPETLPYGLGIDEIHGQAYDPNGRNFAANPGPAVDVPVVIQDVDFDYPYGSESDWVLDNLSFPDVNEPAGTAGHDAPYSGAMRRSDAVDPAHSASIFQEFVPNGHGYNFYGKTIDQNDYAFRSWSSSQTKAPNTKMYPADARENTSNWPEPFDATKVAEMAPVSQPNDRIPMNRMREDDRPVYRMLAVPARNITPSGSRFNPSYPSNVTVRLKNNMVPMMARNPVDPWVTQEADTADDSAQNSAAYVDESGWQ